MNCFLFTDRSTVFSEICGTTVENDLIQHLFNSGVSRIFSDSENNYDDVVNMEFNSARQFLGKDWIAAYGNSITRQSPLKLREIALSRGAGIAISLACSAKPWENKTVLTDSWGVIERIEENPPPENTDTNLCFSGLIWVGEDTFDPMDLSNNNTASAFFLPGYWKCPVNRENYLLTVHEILKGEVTPWPHTRIPSSGRVLRSSVPADTTVRGTLWVGNNCRIECGCTLENCVILDDSYIGDNSNLRNCLIMPGTSIPRKTVQHDKYLSILGDDNGREH